MLSAVFENIVRMSLSASAVIGIVCLVRLLLLKGPRKFCYVLWLAVLLRLLCPFTFTAQVELQPEQLDRELVAIWAEYASGTEMPIAQTQESAGEISAQLGLDAAGLFSLVWLGGFIAMLSYCGVSLVKLRKKLAAAVPLENGIYIADHIGAPFVLGILRPKIYLPSELGEREMAYILAHEKHHIRRGDHFAKLLGFAALSLHWFNPLAWMAFRLFVKDMEASCDEAVLGKLGEGVRADYSQSLLNLAVGRKMPAWTPLTFGEDTRGRIENVLRWHRPSLRRVICAGLVTAVCVGCCFVSVEGVLVPSQQEPQTQREIEEGAEQAAKSLEELGVYPGNICSGDILRYYDPWNRQELTQGQVDTLASLLSRVSIGEIGLKTESVNNEFSIKLGQSDKSVVTLRFGHVGGERCLLVNGNRVDNEALVAYAYHIYISNGCISYCSGDLPEDAVFTGVGHTSRIYSYYCESCGQYESASTSQLCSCCDWNEFEAFFKRISTPGGNHR